MKDTHSRLQEVFHTARDASPDIEKVAPGFEKRVQRRIAQRTQKRSRENVNFYALAWRAVPVCALASLAVFALAFVLANGDSAPLSLALYSDPSLFLAMY